MSLWKCFFITLLYKSLKERIIILEKEIRQEEKLQKSMRIHGTHLHESREKDCGEPEHLEVILERKTSKKQLEELLDWNA